MADEGDHLSDAQRRILLDILDTAAGRSHGEQGKVATALWQILGEHAKMVGHWAPRSTAPDWAHQHRIVCDNGEHGATLILVCLRCGPYLDVGASDSFDQLGFEINQHEQRRHQVTPDVPNSTTVCG
jgi:hypothetical protein